MSALPDVVVIASRFCGPPTSGNGGYVAGRLAHYVDGDAVVRLRVPPPLETPLVVERTSGRARLVGGGTVVAEAHAAPLSLEPPDCPTLREAAHAAHSFRGFRNHWFPSCFVCGTARGPGDGLQIFAGPLPTRGIVACPWIPDPSLRDGGDSVTPAFLWAALDCPGAFAFDEPALGAAVLGEIAVSIRGRVRIGERCVVVGWSLDTHGRKHVVGTALFAQSGECRALARATWIEVPKAPAT
jgi:hypothetical protein